MWNDFRSVLLPNRNAIFSIYGTFLYFRKTFVWKNFMTRKAKPPGNLKIPEVVGLCAWLCGNHDSSKVKKFAGCFRNFMTFVTLLQQLCSQDKVIRFRAKKKLRNNFSIARILFQNIGCLSAKLIVTTQKVIPFGTTHTYRALIRETTPTPGE